MRAWIKILAVLSGTVALPPGSWAECADGLRIVDVDPLAFGTISTAREGGVVIVSPSGAVATLGGVGAGPQAQPGTIQVCGPAGAGFLLIFDPAELNIAPERGAHRPHMVGNLEVVARGAEIHPAAPGQWNGRLGPGGRADIRVGGTLTIPPRHAHDSFAAPFRVAVIATD